LIDEFLALKRFAFVGVSHTPSDFSRLLYAAFLKHGYHLVPVNPSVSEIDGQVCYASVRDIEPPVEGAFIITPPQVTERVVRDCAEAGISRVWLHRGEGLGAVSADAMLFCEEHGISVVPGYCPFMFFDKPGFLHRTHAFFMKLGGNYPN